MRVFVYFNLHRKLYSIKALDGPAKGKVIAHAVEVLLHDVEFKVSEAGRQRVLRERKKNVHAGVVGTLKAWAGEYAKGAEELIEPAGTNHWSDIYTYGWTQRCIEEGEVVRYNPYRWSTFMINDRGRECPVYEADQAYLNSRTREVIARDWA